jgi:hypothetical protein
MKTLRALTIAASMLGPSLAWAACPLPFTGKDAAGATQNLASINDASSNCVFPYAITDGGGAANRASVTGSNALKVDPSAVTQPVSGTVTANIGTAGSLALDATVATVATNTSGIAPATATGTIAGDLVLGSVTTSPPTYTTATLNRLNLTPNGGVRSDMTSIGGAVITPDACQTGAKTSTPISLTANGTVIAKASSKQIYICSINVVVGAATNVAMVEGTQTTNPCDTSTAGISGGTTAATGWNFAANGGLTLGNGMGTVARTATANHDVCLLVSAANQVSGNVVWVQQ